MDTTTEMLTKRDRVEAPEAFLEREKTLQDIINEYHVYQETLDILVKEKNRERVYEGFEEILEGGVNV
jgi:hypothetical protein